MKSNEITEDRRRYYRIMPSVDPTPKVTFEFEGRPYKVKLVNLSPGGLLCYVPDSFPECKVNLYIPKIVIETADKTPVRYAGRIIRVQASGQLDRRFCAVEFVQIDQKRLKKGSKPIKPFQAGEDDELFIQRLQSVKSFLKGRSIDEEMILRRSLYDIFAEEAGRLPLEERWYFYEILDEMKRLEPDYPPAMRKEFVRLCRGEDRSEFVPMRLHIPFWKRLTQRLFRRQRLHLQHC